eukprot:scaffold219_cov156-Amphora_coffeaeformis.AAC.11
MRLYQGATTSPPMCGDMEGRDLLLTVPVQNEAGHLAAPLPPHRSEDITNTTPLDLLVSTKVPSTTSS